VTLAEARRSFAAKPTARLLAAFVAVTLAARAAVGDVGVTDLLVVVGVLAAEPFTEWLIHVFLLHFRPRTVGGRTIDLAIARKHRRHHADPRDLDILFIPLEVVALAPVVALGLPLVAGAGWGTTLTFALTSFSMLLAYEWTHYLIHTSYRPRTRLYRRIWRAHRWHHYRNERYWFGVTVHLADRLLGTYPDRDDVPLSDTAKSLEPAAR
jgi:sterol desaturase/sphingolipid hydroxylase (fatty acid hydroxylase superfamily)